MTRAEAISRLARQPDPVTPGEDYTVGAFVPEDAEGVAALFYRVYGEAYPIDTYYMPERIREVCAAGQVFPVVARQDHGGILGFAALYQSSPPFPGILEYGLGAIHPLYRGSFVLFHLFTAIIDLLRTLPDVEGVFGEAVCDKVIMQHTASLFGFRETGIELGLMPPKAPGADRTSCLLIFLGVQDRRRRLYVPDCWTKQVEWLVTRAGLERDLVSVAAGMPAADTHLDFKVFEAAKVLRVNLFRLGSDWQARLQEAEDQAAAQGCEVFQLFINAGEASAVAAVPRLHQSGYALGGIIPRWFDDDALFMQKLTVPLDLGGIALYSDDARTILAMALEDQAAHPDQPPKANGATGHTTP